MSKGWHGECRHQGYHLSTQPCPLRCRLNSLVFSSTPVLLILPPFSQNIKTQTKVSFYTLCRTAQRRLPFITTFLNNQNLKENPFIYRWLQITNSLSAQPCPMMLLLLFFFPDSTVVKHFHQKHNVFSWKLHKRFGLNYSYFTVRLKKISTFFVVHKNKWSFKLFYWWKKCFKLLIWNLNTEKDCKASQSTQNKGFETVDSFLQFKKKI